MKSLLLALILMQPAALSALTPTVGDAAPQSSVGPTSTLTFTFADSAGYQDLGVLNVLINNFLDGRQACYVAYSQPDNVLYLVDDPGIGINGFPLKGSGTLSNSQCTISLASSSAVPNADGKALTLTLAVTFNAASFSGARVIYAAGRDVAQNSSGWQDRGVVYIPPVAPQYPVTANLSPSQGADFQKTFSVTYRDATSYANIRAAQILINSALDGANACYLGYDRGNNLLYLISDTSGTLLPTPVIPGSGTTAGSGTVSNSQCTVNGPGTTVTTGGTDFTLNINLTFSASFGGSRIVYTGVQTNAGANSGWLATGFWTVTPPPAVVSVYPTSGATAIPLNSRVVLTFSTPVDPTSLSSGITLQQGTGTMPGTVVLAPDNLSAVFRPTSQFGTGLTYTIRVNSVKTVGGATVPAFSSSFTSGLTPDSLAAQLTVSPAGTSVPINALIQIHSNKRLDPASFSNLNLYPQNIPVTYQFSLDGLGATLTPVNLLAVGQSYSISGNILLDINGNNVFPYITFVTGFTADTAGPRLTGSYPAPGATGVPTNVQPQLRFDSAVSPTTLAAIQLKAGTQTLAVTATASPDGQSVTLVPTALLAGNTVYTVVFSSGLTGLGGGPLQNPGASSFSTGAGPDLNYLTVAMVNPPPDSQNVATNARVRVRLNKPLNPIPLSVSPNPPVSGTTTVSTDGMTVTFVPSQPLAPYSVYTFALKGVQDAEGTSFDGLQATSFRTGSGPDTTAPNLLFLSPPDTAGGVPLNTRVVAQFDQPLDPTTVNGSSIRLQQGITPIGGAVFLASDNATIIFTPAGALMGQTTYTAVVSGVTDMAGNAAKTTNASFTTASSQDVTRPAVVSVSPSNGAAGVAVNTPIAITFNKPVSAASLAGGVTISYRVGANQQVVVGGTFGVSGNVATFTPALPLPGSTTITVAVSTVQDFAGNFAANSSTSFTTQAVVDTTAPAVTSVTPADGSTNVSFTGTVVLTFSKPLNPTTVSTDTFAMLNSPSMDPLQIQLSPDARTVTLRRYPPSVPPNVTVIVTSDVTDIAGNHLPDFRSQFTISAADTSSPVVVTQRPSNGATGVSPTGTITLVFSEPIDPSSVPGAVHISQNGTLVAGTTTLVGNSQALLFTPTVPLAAGALVQVFVDATVRDAFGNHANQYQGQFTVQPATSSFAITRYSPSNSSQQGVPLNAGFDVEFSQPVDPATVTQANVYLRLNGSGANVAATLSLRSPTVIRLRPSAPLTANSNYALSVTTGVKGVQGQTFSYGGFYYFLTGAASDTSALTATFGPPPGSTNTGTNTTVRIDFNKPINPVTVTGSSVQLSAGGTQLPTTLSISSDYRTVFLSPQGLLPDSTAILVSVSNVEDPTGTAISAVNQFATGASLDVTPPALVSASVGRQATGIPVNAAITLSFSEPVDPGAISYSCHFINGGSSPIAGTFAFSADFRQATFTPAAAWPVGFSISLSNCTMQDFAGNSASVDFVSFTTAFQPDITPPSVLGVSPAAGLAQVPINAQVQVLFNEPVQATSLGGVTLSVGASAVAASASLDYTSQIVTLAPAVPLQPNTTYSISIAGVKDLAGNLMSGPQAGTFTTGTGADLVPPVLTVSPPYNATGVGTNVPVRVVFSERINPLSLMLGLALSKSVTYPGVPQPVSATVSIGADGRSAILTPAAPLAPNTTYIVQTPAVPDLAGNATSYSGTSSTFTTGAGTDTSAPGVAFVSPPNGATDVPINTLFQVQMNETMDPTTVPGSFKVMTGATTIAGSLTFNNTTIFFRAASPLAPSASYTIQVSGVTNLVGIPLAPFTSTFTTSASSIPDLTLPAVTGITPADGATGVPVNSAIVLTFNKMISPASVYSGAFNVSTSGIKIPGVYSAAGPVVTFTPASPLSGNATITVFVTVVTDLAGTANGTTFTSQFVTAAASDTTPPTVTSVNPADGSTGVPNTTSVVLTFSKPLNPATVTASSFALFNGATKLAVTPSRSDDSRTVTLAYYQFPLNATITVVVTHDVTDLAGNRLADFSSQFTTATFVAGSAPRVTSTQPAAFANNVAAGTTITFTFDRPMDPTTFANGIFISQNGVLVDGAFQSPAPNSVQFTPYFSFGAGATVQIFVTTAVKDASGISAVAFSATFTIAGTKTLSVIRTSPAPEAMVASDGVIDVEFSAPLDPSTIPNTAILRDARTLRFRAAPELPLSGVIRSLDGRQFGGQTFRYRMGTEAATIPSIVRTGLEHGAVRVDFSGPINPLTASESTVRLYDTTGAAVPFRIAFTPDDGSLLLYPAKSSDPLRVSIDGIESLSGVRIPKADTLLPRP